MEYSAITHYMERRYCYALEKGKFLIRLETKKDDIKKVVLHYHDKYIPIEYFDTRTSKEMVKVGGDRFKDYFEVIIDIDAICIRYQFEIIDFDENKTYYGNYDFYEEKINNNDKCFDLPQNLREEEMFDIPKWAPNKVVYQIFPSRYATSKKVSEKTWYTSPIGIGDNLKGDIRGIINTLEHLKELGVDVLYMTPIFLSESFHKYDTIDYYKIDDTFGSEEDLKELVEKAHGYGMRVVLDAVFNHTSPKFFAFDDIKKKKLDSEYANWYYVEGFPLKSGSRMERPNFKTFAYYGGMPKLNLNNKATADYFINVAKYWIEKCDIDGWRLDVGDEVIHSFWKRFRKEIKEVKNDAIIIGEIWHYAGDFLEGDEWDTVMNYPFYLAVLDFVAKGSITASRFLEHLDFVRGRLHKGVNDILWNLIDSHDTARFLYVSGENKEKLKLAAAIQLLLPGMPMIYYGDEYGMTGGHDPDCRRGMLWDEKYQDKEMFKWYCSLIKVRKELKSLTEGEVEERYADDDKGIIKITSVLGNEKTTVIFHGKEGVEELLSYKGKVDAITGKVFEGMLGSYETVVFKENV